MSPRHGTKRRSVASGVGESHEEKNMTTFELLFDNGGGILLMTADYCHSYERPWWAAVDVAELLNGRSTDNWEGNEPEFRREKHVEDDYMSCNTARLIFDGEQWAHRGAAWEAFCFELAAMGGKSQAVAS